MAQEKPEHHRKRRQLVWMIVSLLLAAAVIVSAIWLRSNRYFYSSESHSLEAFRGLEGKGEVQSPEDSANLARRQELLLNGQAENDAMIGWLVLPGTMIDYPVMGGKDSSRYAEQNYDGKYDKYGTPYLAETCRTDFSDYFSVIYGHDMNNSTMFGSLERFQNADVFADAQDGVLILEDGEHFGDGDGAGSGGRSDGYRTGATRTAVPAAAAGGGADPGCFRDRGRPLGATLHAGLCR